MLVDGEASETDIFYFHIFPLKPKICLFLQMSLSVVVAVAVDFPILLIAERRSRRREVLASL